MGSFQAHSEGSLSPASQSLEPVPLSPPPQSLEPLHDQHYGLATSTANYTMPLAASTNQVYASAHMLHHQLLNTHRLDVAAKHSSQNFPIAHAVHPVIPHLDSHPDLQEPLGTAAHIQLSNNIEKHAEDDDGEVDDGEMYGDRHASARRRKSSRELKILIYLFFYFSKEECSVLCLFKLQRTLMKKLCRSECR
jgi:hypothetical protein